MKLIHILIMSENKLLSIFPITLLYYVLVHESHFNKSPTTNLNDRWRAMRWAISAPVGICIYKKKKNLITFFK